MDEIVVHTPNGHTLRFPAGTPRSTIDAAVRRATGQISITPSPNGQFRETAPAQAGGAPAMLPDDYSFPGGMHAAEEPRQPTSSGPMAAGGINAFANDATLGLWNHAQAGVNAIPALWPGGQTFGERYQENLTGINETIDYFDENTHPWISGAVHMAGALAPVALIPGAAMATLPKAGMLVNSLRGATLGSGGGMMYGFLDGDGDFNERADNALLGWALGFGGGAALPPLMQGAGAVGRRFGVALQKPPQQAGDLAAVRNSYDEMGVSVPQRIEDSFADIPPGASRFSEETLAATGDLYDDLTLRLYQNIPDHRVSQNEIVGALSPAIDDMAEALGRTGPLQPGSPEAVLEDILQRATRFGDEGVPLAQIERWRQRINKNITNAFRGGRGDDGELLISVRDALDDGILALTESAAPARQAYLTSIRLSALREASERAADRAAQGGDYNALFRRELQSMKRRKVWDRFSPEQQQAITDAIRVQGPLAPLERMMSMVIPPGLGRTVANSVGPLGAAATGNAAMAIPAALSLANSLTGNRALNRALDAIPETVLPRPQVAPIEEVVRLGLEQATVPAVWSQQSGF
jgi:hypothetical protein